MEYMKKIIFEFFNFFVKTKPRIICKLYIFGFSSLRSTTLVSIWTLKNERILAKNEPENSKGGVFDLFIYLLLPLI